MARQLGYTAEDLAALDHLQAVESFDPALRAALDYARRMTRNAHTVTDEVFADLRAHYDVAAVVELTAVIGLANYWNRFTTALRIDLSGTDEPYDPPGGR